MVVLMASSGMRKGALPLLRLKDIDRIEKYGVLKFTVYKNEQESYITYCTPQCTQLIDLYLRWRERQGEKFTPDTPLFRTGFSPEDANKPISLGLYGIAKQINRLLLLTEIKTPVPA